MTLKNAATADFFFFSLYRSFTFQKKCLLVKHKTLAING